MYTPGPIAEFNVFPQIGPGPTGPLLFNPPDLIATPEIQRMGVGRLVTYRQWGFPVGYLPPEVANLALRDWAKGPAQAWGIGRETAQLDDYDQFQNPAASSEVIREFDRQRCIIADSQNIQPDGRAFELVRYTVPTASVGILERLPTTFEVEALDLVTRAPIFDYGGLNGGRPCLDRIVHPSPGGGVLTWQWRVTVTHTGLPEGAAPPYLTGVLARDVQGDDLVEPWSDLRDGHAEPWGDRRQYITHPRVTLHYWIILFAPANSFRVTAGGRLGGYWQIAGRHGAALQAATHRIV